MNLQEVLAFLVQCVASKTNIDVTLSNDKVFSGLYLGRDEIGLVIIHRNDNLSKLLFADIRALTISRPLPRVEKRVRSFCILPFSNSF